MIFGALGSLALGEVPAAVVATSFGYTGGAGAGVGGGSIGPIPRIKITIPGLGRQSIPGVRIRSQRQPRTILPSPYKPRADTGNQPEILEGTVQNMKASAPEERLARALGKQQTDFEFRHTIGAPRGLPGWKEIDFIVPSFGQVYAVEVDTAFTHREKGRADVLHDAIALVELKKEGMTVYPMVLHVDGESDLATRENATAWVKQRFQPAQKFPVIVEAEPERAKQAKKAIEAPTQVPPVQSAQPAEKELSNYQKQIKARQLARGGPVAKPKRGHK